MNYLELKNEIDNYLNENVSQAKIAKALDTTVQNLNKKIKNINTEVTLSDIYKIENYFKISILNASDCVTLEHIHINPSCGSGTVVIDEPAITPIKLGRKLLETILRVSNINNLKTFTAIGDSMEDTINDHDLLLVDTGRLDFNNGGVFLLQRDNDWFVKRLRLKLNGELEVISDNKKYGIEIFKPDDNVEIKIKGRVIKNLSKGL